MRLAGISIFFAAFLGFSEGCADLDHQIVADFLPSASVEVAKDRADGIPRRANGAMTGQEFVRYIEPMGTVEREAAILREYLNGNDPSFLRAMKPVKVSITSGDTTASPFGKTGIFWTLPDYLAIGSDEDYVYTPMNPLTAQKIADHFGMVLPTRKMVDDIYAQADVHLKPAPMPAGPTMRSTDYFRRHNETIQKQLGLGHRGELIAGHKKDVVISNRLGDNRRRVAIYGWHKEDGKPIQPLSTVHGELYADYSHGVRLVSKMMTIDGNDVPLVEVLHDPGFVALVSDEGTLRLTRIAVDCRDC